ncbi:MAG: branched-chain amino acid aminotransferase, partial [Acidobacteria bacterium]
MPVELSQEQATVYIDGEYLPFKEAKVSVFDHGLLYGDAVYDTCFAWAGAIFKLPGWRFSFIPLTKEQMKSAILDTFAKNRLESAYIKILVTRGLGKRPLLPPIDCTPSIIVFAVPYTGAVYSGEVGIKATVVSRRHIPSVCLDSQVKSCNYSNFVLSQREAMAAGTDVAIQLDMAGHVCEAPGYNIFAVKAGNLLTPGGEILRGITRQTVIELAGEAQIPCREAELATFDLYNADELFLTSTAGGIVPIREVDGIMV